MDIAIGSQGDAAREKCEGPETSGSLIRVIISSEASRLLDDLTDIVNEGFDAGKVSRSQVLNWLLKRFSRLAGDDEIAEIRAAHFDRIAYLEVLLKRAKSTGVLPPELNAVIQVPGVHGGATKKRRSLTKNITNDDLINDDI